MDILWIFRYYVGAQKYLFEINIIFLIQTWYGTLDFIASLKTYYSWSLFWFLLITEGAPSRLQWNSSFAFGNHLFGIPTIFEKNFSKKCQKLEYNPAQKINRVPDCNTDYTVYVIKKLVKSYFSWSAENWPSCSTVLW